jgi:CheY-like chemotaxis protein
MVSRRMPDALILVVDDDPTIRAAVAELLEVEDYAVAVAANGMEALEIVARVRPRLVVLDMRMPVLDGWGSIRALREGEYQPQILAMSAAHDARRWADEVGATGHVSKPFEADDLFVAVRRALVEVAEAGG